MMKGKSLIELATAVQEQASRKVDVVADTRNIAFKVIEKKPVLEIETANQVVEAEVTNHALGQITEHTGIPSKYAQRMMVEAPELMERNVNHWLQKNDALRMVRMITANAVAGAGIQRATARAFLSNRYRRMEHDQLLATVLPTLLNNSNGLQVLSTEVTETRMYIKAVFTALEGEVKVGDLVQYGFELTNSEIGMGAMALTPFIYRLICTNGMKVGKEIDDARMRKAHLGGAMEIGADYFTDETNKVSDTALALQLRDTLLAFQDKNRWNAVLGKMRDAANTDKVANPIEVVKRIGETLALPQGEQNSVLTNFLRDGDLTKWGLVNAVTAVANDANDYDRAGELETFGGRILALPASDWNRLAIAA